MSNSQEVFKDKIPKGGSLESQPGMDPDLSDCHTVYYESQKLVPGLFFARKTIVMVILCSGLLFNLLPSENDFYGALRAQNVAINATGNAANTSAVLDLDAGNRGLLIPRVSLTSADDILTISSPAVSLLIYNTASAGTFPANVVPGFYFWNGTKWTSLTSQNCVLAYADFYALMPPDNPATVAAGAAVSFPNQGPSGSTAITALSGTEFQLSEPGTYMITWQVSVNEAGQLLLELNGTEDLTTVVGRATGTSQITGTRLIIITAANTVLRVVNPLGSPTVLTITVTAGGSRPVSASLVITRIR